MLNRSRTWAGIVLVATFASGIVVGGAAAAAWAQYHKPTDARRPGYAERLQHDLQLTAAQRESVDVILKSYQPRVTANWDAVRPAVEAYNARWDTIRTEVRSRIAPLLSADQRRAFQEISARSDSARKAHEQRSQRTRDSAAAHAR